MRDVVGGFDCAFLFLFFVCIQKALSDIDKDFQPNTQYRNA